VELSAALAAQVIRLQLHHHKVTSAAEAPQARLDTVVVEAAALRELDLQAQQLLAVLAVREPLIAAHHMRVVAAAELMQAPRLALLVEQAAGQMAESIVL
jgi:hypothetical protein